MTVSSVVFKDMFREIKLPKNCLEAILAALTGGESVNIQAILVEDISDVES